MNHAATSSTSTSFDNPVSPSSSTQSMSFDTANAPDFSETYTTDSISAYLKYNKCGNIGLKSDCYVYCKK